MIRGGVRVTFKSLGVSSDANKLDRDGTSYRCSRKQSQFDHRVDSESVLLPVGVEMSRLVVSVGVS